MTTTLHSSRWRAGRRCSWPDARCEALAAGGRAAWCATTCRDSGESTTADPEAPAYSLRDLAADAVALADALGGGPAHLAGIGVGGMVAQVAAVDHPGVFSALTLAGTRPVAPGPPDDDLPEVRRPAADRRHRLTMHFREWYAADPRRRVPEVDFGRVWTDQNHPHQQWSVSWNPGTGEPYTFNHANPQITVLAVFATALYGDFDTVSSANASGRRHVSDSGSSTRTGRRSALVHVRGGASELVSVR